MRYEARITAYDMLDQVMVVVNAQDTARGADQDSGEVLNISVTLEGTGMNGIAPWLKEALVALLGAL